MEVVEEVLQVKEFIKDNLVKYTYVTRNSRGFLDCSSAKQGTNTNNMQDMMEGIFLSVSPVAY